MQEQHVCTDHVWLLFFDDLNFAAGTLMDSSQLFIGWAAKVCQHQVCHHNTVFRQMFHKSSLGTQIEMLPLYLYKKYMNLIHYNTIILWEGTITFPLKFFFALFNPRAFLRKLSFLIYSENVEILHLLRRIQKACVEEGGSFKE